MDQQNSNNSMGYAICPVTAFQQNCTIFWCKESKKAAIVDPGGDLERVLAVCEKNQLTPECILVTHGHIDHAGAVAELSEKLNLPIYGPHYDDLFWIEGMDDQQASFYFPHEVRSFTPTRWLEHGDQVSFGNITLEVLHCPGHTPGHVVFFHQDSQLMQVGDVIFQGSIGRTDFPKGNHEQLINSIRNRLFTLGDEVRFIPGHGPMSSIYQEKRSNPYCSEQAAGKR